MEKLSFEFAAEAPVTRNIRIGVVASGDLEVLLSPAPSTLACVTVTTAVNGKKTTWEALLQRFFETPGRAAALIHINDNGATPGVVKLRLEQAFELANRTRHDRPL